MMPCPNSRSRLVEDIPDDLKPEATEYTIHRDWCPCCKKQVEPKLPDALPNCTLGNRTVVLSAWLHNVGMPRHGPDGAFIGFIGCSFDVTDIRQAGEAARGRSEQV